MTHLGYLYDNRFLLHDTGASHPEQPSRLSAINESLSTQFSGFSKLHKIEAAEAEYNPVVAVHTDQYLKRLKAACKSGESFIDVPDSAISKESFNVALLAAGGAIRAAELIATNQINRAFCAVRPPGHHAERDRSMGFCLLNNVAIVTRYLLDFSNMSRILIFDWDVHHGNGTQNIFYEDKRVYYCSMHGDPRTLYPGTGFEEERGGKNAPGTNLNIPLKPGTSDSAYRESFAQKFLPWAKEAAPEFIIVSAGFDAHRDDPLGNLELSSETFAYLTKEIVGLSKEFCEGKVLSILEGGYNLKALSESVLTHMNALAED
jgi:acetoin utilization deacetylase AcuC-like enzyme